MLTLLEEELRRRLCETAGLALVCHTSSVIAATSGAVAIGDLSVAAGVSSTHLAQRFKELIGVTPERLARTYRFTATVLRSPGSRRPGRRSPAAVPSANIPATCWTADRGRPIVLLQDGQLTTR